MNKDIAENFIVECGTESIQIGDALKMHSINVQILTVSYAPIM